MNEDASEVTAVEVTVTEKASTRKERKAKRAKLFSVTAYLDRKEQKKHDKAHARGHHSH